MLELWVDWVMDQMKGRKQLHLHFTWGELWVQDLVLVGLLDSLLHSQQLETTYSQTLEAKIINLVGSKSKILKFYTRPITFSLILCVSALSRLLSSLAWWILLVYIFLTLLWLYCFKFKLLLGLNVLCVWLIAISSRLQCPKYLVTLLSCKIYGCCWR